MASSSAPPTALRERTIAVTKLRVAHSPDNHRLEYLREARRFTRRKNIHRRKVMPPLRFGELIGDAEPTPALSLDGGGGGAAMALAMAPPPPPLMLHSNIQLTSVATAGTASHVCEPSVAMNGNVIFATGNWFASVSTDGGATYLYVNPGGSFPNPKNSRFCCDQIAIYSPAEDLFFWLLQYTENHLGENVQRIAYATTAEVTAGKWRYFDISSKALGFPRSWLDFPDLAVTDDFLYMTTNAFRGEDWVGTAIARVSLQSIVAGTISAEKVVSRKLPSFRVAQNCSGTVYWAAHDTNSRITVHAWPESGASATAFDVDVPTWNQSGAYVSMTPDNRNWLDRTDGRMTGAAQAGQHLFFAWTAGAGGVNARPHPYVQVARVDIPTGALAESINLWDPDDAIACAAFGVNDQNEVGVAYALGGPTRYPSHVVGILTGSPAYKTTFAGQRGPEDQVWGDYLAVRRCFPQQDRFIATGYTLPAGTSDRDSIPNITIFGR